jgi:hypothetical protein
MRQLFFYLAPAMLKFLFFIGCLSLTGLCAGQVPSDGFSRQPLSSLERALQLLHHSKREHAVIQPLAFGTEQSFYSLSDSSAQADSLGVKFKLRPLFQLGGGLAISREEAGPLAAGFSGLDMELSSSRRWCLSAGYVWAAQLGLPYLQQYADSLHVLPSWGFSRALGNQAQHTHVPFFRAQYAAGKYFHFELGNGKNFWGNGYRSLILGDHVAPYPYFRVTTKVWKIKYTGLFLKLRDISENPVWRNARGKYAALHALSWNATKRLNLSFFEMVVWQDRDSLNQRNLDLHYLNPLIFYRPVEFAQGSADNVLIGGGFQFRAHKKVSLYGQFVLDEFLLKAISERTGWWANKYGGQLGLKWFDFLLPGLSLQTEWNGVRPFTYSHGSPVQAWGHLNQPLAHPMGANFSEWVNFLHFTSGKWVFRQQFTWALFGRDNVGENLGGNIFQSYASPTRSYGNIMFQGNRHAFHYAELMVSRPSTNYPAFEFFASQGLRWLKSSTDKQMDVWLMAGIRVRRAMNSPIDF